MRFELVLSGLPDVSVEDAKQKLADLPKGVSTGVIIKAMQDARLPSVAVAWSEDKRVLNEIQDRIAEIGGHSDVVDHGFFLFRIITWISERLGATRYRKAQKEDRSYVKIGDKYKQSTPMSDVTRGAIIVAMQMLLVEVLFVWRVSLKVGAGSLGSATWLPELLVACGVGVVCAYMLARAVEGWRSGRVSQLRAAPFILLSVGCTIASLFFVSAEREAEIARRSIGRPTSNPYAGLLTELRKRLAKGELTLQTDGTQLGAGLASGEDEVGERMCVDPSEFDPSLRACMIGPDWEQAGACLTPPAPPKAPRLAFSKPAKPPRVPVVRQTIKRKVSPRPWGITLEKHEAAELALLWALSLSALAFFLSRRARPATSVEAAAQAPGLSGQAPASVSEAEVQALREQLVQAQGTAQQALAHLARLRTAGAPDAQMLQAQLAATQAELLVHRNAVAQVREQLKPVREEHAAHLAEIARLRQLLSQVSARLNTQPAVKAPAARAQAPANNQGSSKQSASEKTGAFPDEGSSSSYSVVAGQEERVFAPKRRG